MKKIILLISSLLLALNLYSQDLIILEHTNYTSTFNKTLHYPVLVEWWETRAKLQCNQLARKDNFRPDPLIPDETNLAKDYLNSGYDRGHMCPDEDSKCQGQLVQSECFYFSNIAPQPHGLNGGIWKTLEFISQKIAITQDSVHVWAGCVGNVGMIGKVAIPEKCWKVLYVKKTNQYLAYIFNNVEKQGKYLRAYQVDLSEITNLTGISFE